MLCVGRAGCPALRQAARRCAGCCGWHNPSALPLKLRKTSTPRTTSTSPRSEGGGSETTFICPTELATAVLASLFAQKCQAGDAFLLFGDVGVGKSAFSRAFVRAALDDESEPVPSPTFLLQLMYTTPTGMPIHHFDLYRLDPAAPGSFNRLELPRSFATAVALVEWADRLPLDMLPDNRLDVHLAQLDPAEVQLLSAAMPPQDFWLSEEDMGGDDEEDVGGPELLMGDLPLASPENSSGSDGREFHSSWRRIQCVACGEGWARRLATVTAAARSLPCIGGLTVLDPKAAGT